jgi:hypothetical protein
MHDVLKHPKPAPAVASRPATLEIPVTALRVIGDQVPEGMTILVVPPSTIQPEFIRLPKAPAVCPVTGLPRTTMVELLKEAGSKVKVRRFRKRGSTRGVLLIGRQSLIDYIDGQPAPDWVGSPTGDLEGEGEE